MRKTFACKAANQEEMLEITRREINTTECHIAAEQALTKAGWNNFTASLLTSCEFLANFTEVCNALDLYKNDSHPCIWVHCPELGEGILVNTEGYNYARYTAPHKG